MTVHLHNTAAVKRRDFYVDFWRIFQSVKIRWHWRFRFASSLPWHNTAQLFNL